MAERKRQLTAKDREDIANYLAAATTTVAELSRTYQVSDRTIRRIREQQSFERKEYHQTNREKLRSQDKLEIDQLLAKNSAIRLSEIAAKLSVQVSRNTIDRYIKSKGIKYYVALNKTKLQPVHLQARRAFALQNVNQSAEFWKRVVFTDETKVKNNCGKIFIRTTKEERMNVEHYNRRTRRKFSVNIFGFINYYVSEIFRISNNFDRTEMFNLLHHGGIINHLKDLIPAPVVYQQDNLSVHLVPEVVNLFSEMNGITLIENWPPYSPDINPIEKAWAILKKKTYQKLQTQEINSDDELFNVVKEAFYEIKQETIREMIFKVPFLLEQLVRTGGELTSN